MRERQSSSDRSNLNPAAFHREVLEKLEALGDLELRRMFGGAGLYHRGVFFAILGRTRFYFKVDDVTRPEYEAHGMGPFRPSGIPGIQRRAVRLPVRCRTEITA